ncbi:unnamed protein product [Rotaria magnacalcarata]|uniref:Uncharacterized protein n=3 Tax=Rotaria magnacalcarata TaxID=392030 RepID=A0A816GC26_9BILA|nr:unnamed protein product [Rotaria magnacalcarata]CAF1672219.1 unnamed protein product [Rotaria magnacalcarata]CAF1978899.1 unnamed protein product [Rotaria magnacalcarata]CAF2071790.1 unnamed protein product [Rotaria magnacalcarata]CAF2135111.1 unnamed protein product [Rotaria magnacalcarata]
MKRAINDRKTKKKVLTKKISKKKKLFKDPFLRELDQKKVTKTESKLPILPTHTTKEDDKIYARTAANKANVARLLPKTRLQLPTHALRSARTFAQCPSVSVVSNEEADTQHHQLPVVCSRGALNFHARRLGTSQRVDNEYRLGQVKKRVAGKIKIDQL